MKRFFLGLLAVFATNKPEKFNEKDFYYEPVRRTHKQSIKQQTPEWLLKQVAYERTLLRELKEHERDIPNS